MTCSKKILSFFFGLGLIIATPAVLAKTDPAATTLFAKGAVTAESPTHGHRQLEKSAAIYEDERINTHTDGRVQLRFTDGGLVSLMPDTLFTVEEYFYDSEDEGALVFGLLKGGLRTVTGAVGKKQHEQYELKTPVATLGIRGTEYIAVLNPPNTLRVHVGRGKVVLTNDQGELRSEEGHNGIVVQGQAPQLSDEPPVFASITDNFLEGPAETHFSDPLASEDLLNLPELSLDSLPEPAGVDPSDPISPGGLDPDLDYPVEPIWIEGPDDPFFHEDFCIPDDGGWLCNFTP